MKAKFKAKRLIAVLLTMILVLALMPISAFAADGVAINETNFPDAIFRERVQNSYDKDSDKILSDSEIANVTTISVSSKGISSLKGIEFFANLTRLDCKKNNLTNLDVSNNTKLDYLDCSGNKLTELDVSNNTKLTELDCDTNELTELDVSNNTALTYLSCGSNKLTELDVSNNTALTSLLCSSNKLTEFDVSNNTALTFLLCSNNNLTELDVSNNIALTSLTCYKNNLTELDVSNNTKLDYLDCDGNKLTELDVSKNTALTSLTCYNNNLTELDVSKNTALTSLLCYNNNLTELDVSKNTALTGLLCSSNKLTELDVSNNTALTSLLCSSNKLTELDLSNNTKLTKLDCSKNKLEVEVSSDRIFDLNTLPGNFDVTRASNWKNAEVNGNILTLKENTSEATYTYDLGNGKTETFRISYTIPHVHEYGSNWRYNGTEHWRFCSCGTETNRTSHNFAIKGTVEATEDKEGYTGDKYCDCGYEVKGHVIPKLHTHSYGDWQYDENGHWKECACGDKISKPHSESEIINAKEATEAEAGYTGDLACPDCGCVFEKGEIIPQIHTHSYSNDWGFDDTNHWKDCSCGEQSEVAEHDFVIENEKEPTDTEMGYTGDKVCSVCDYTKEGTYYEKPDSDKPGTHEHNFGDTWISDGTNHWKKCDGCDEKAESGGHTVDLVNAKDPTKTEPGYSGDKACTVCGHVVEKGEEVPATGSGIDVSKIVGFVKKIIDEIDTEAISDIVGKVKGLLGKIEIDSDTIANVIDQIKDAVGDSKAPTDGTEDDKPSSDKDNNTNVDADANTNAGANTNSGSANGAGDGSAESSGTLPNTGATVSLAAFAALSVAAAAAFVSKKKKD